MFPSAANIKNECSQSPPTSNNSPSSDWIHSSSYQASTIYNAYNVQPESSKHSLKKEKKRKNKRCSSLSPPKKPSHVCEHETFRMDRDCNKHIYKFGSIYEGELAKYKIQERHPILGFQYLRVLDLSPDAVKAEVKRNRRMRYFSKKNHIRILAPATACSNKENNIDFDKNETFLSVSENLVSISPPKSTSSSDLNLKKVTDLNRLVYESTGDIQAWLELIKLQLTVSGAGEFTNLIARRFTLLEKQIVIVERAISANSGNLRLRLLLAGLRELATQLISAGGASMRTVPDHLAQKNLVSQEWTNLVFTCPQFVTVWRSYIAHLRGRFAMFGSASSVFNCIDSIYRRALTTLSGIVSGRILSHKPQEDTSNLIIDLLAEYCAWLSQSGFTERALSIWQTAIEFACFCPSRLLSIYCTTFGERQQAFRVFWESKTALFGHPDAHGWAGWDQVNEQVTCQPTSPASKHAVESVTGELEEDWELSSTTRKAKWSHIATAWNKTAESAEDALLQLQTTESAQQYHSTSGHLGNLQTRGLAWIGLERTRESLGWLPASMTTNQEMEDVEREVLFDVVQPCLLEVHLQPDVSVECLDGYRQRLVLLFLEFLGLWDNEIAIQYNLPIDLRLCHELSTVSCLHRQRITPRQFGFPWLSSSTSSSADSKTVRNTSTRMCNALIGCALEQASRLFTHDTIWASTIGQLRFRHLTNSISAALESQKITSKVALLVWRKKAKRLLSRPTAQTDLNLWLMFANGLVQTGFSQTTPINHSEGTLFFAEARRIFTSTLIMYPVPEPQSTVAHTALLSRLQTVHCFLALELCVDFPVDVERPPSDVCIFNALHLILYTASGGAYTPPPTPESQSGFDGVTLTEAATRLAQRLNRVKESIILEDLSTTGTNIEVTVKMASLLASFIFHLHFLVLDENCMESACHIIFQTLAELDTVYTTVKKVDQGIKLSRFSPDPSAVSGGPGYVTRSFLRLVIPSITSISLFRRRNRCSVTERFLNHLAQFHASPASSVSVGSTQLPLTITPQQWIHLLPYRVGAKCAGNLDRTCSIKYQRNLQGLLPPLLLSSLQARFSQTCEMVLSTVASHTTLNAHLVTVGRRIAPTKRNAVEDNTTSPALLLGLSSGSSSSSTQAELLAYCLPASLDLLGIGLELERWTSLMAGSDAPAFAGSDSTSNCWSRGAVTRLRAAFESALAPPSLLTRYPHMDPLVSTLTPSFWVDHLRTVLWSAYMAFEFNAAAANTASEEASEVNVEIISNPDAHRKQRAAIKAIFYRAIEDLPWAKVLYVDLVRYCPEDVEEVVDLLTSKALRLRTPLEEVDLLLHS